MNQPDESIEREGYEHSNSLPKCQIHLCEMQTDSRGRDFCEMCQHDGAMAAQEWDDEHLGEP